MTLSCGWTCSTRTTGDLQLVVEEFGLHPLAVEDAVHDHQRPKLDRYATHLFATHTRLAIHRRPPAYTQGGPSSRHPRPG